VWGYFGGEGKTILQTFRNVPESWTWPLDDYVTLPFGTNSSIYCNLAKRDVEHFSPEHFSGGISTRNSATNLHVKAHNPRLLIEQEWTFQNASGVLPS
jgi:thioredoxin-related protein